MADLTRPEQQKNYRTPVQNFRQSLLMLAGPDKSAKKMPSKNVQFKPKVPNLSQKC